VKARYIIRHHPGLFTEILVERDGQVPVQTETRYSWGVAREYCRDNVKAHGVEPVIEKPDAYTEVFPWVECGYPPLPRSDDKRAQDDAKQGLQMQGMSGSVVVE